MRSHSEERVLFLSKCAQYLQALCKRPDLKEGMVAMQGLLPTENLDNPVIPPNPGRPHPSALGMQPPPPPLNATPLQLAFHRARINPLAPADPPPPTV